MLRAVPALIALVLSLASAPAADAQLASTLVATGLDQPILVNAPQGDPRELIARMENQLAKRDATQPTKDRSAGSTFRNPAGFSSRRTSQGAPGIAIPTIDNNIDRAKATPIIETMIITKTLLKETKP